MMGKDQRWGNKLQDKLKNGDWIHAVYDATSKPLMGRLHEVSRLPHAAGAEEFRPSSR